MAIHSVQHTGRSTFGVNSACLDEVAQVTTAGCRGWISILAIDSMKARLGLAWPV